MSAGQKNTDARDARACLKAVNSVGVAPAGWARAHGIDGRSTGGSGISAAAARSRSRRHGSSNSCPRRSRDLRRGVLAYGAVKFRCGDCGRDRLAAPS